ncbi:hypothetical protein DPMN_097744 [Dreissena polymorpha]|uniref:Uncharacterized protein n=1 Tax=Dreissena polymorpha TaxID=45954 RepID=A0A9D4R4U4_DREPO|nr:hypothetical protein DPMN_097744 [Dreissena polymorpha]
MVLNERSSEAVDTGIASNRWKHLAIFGYKSSDRASSVVPREGVDEICVCSQRNFQR